MIDARNLVADDEPQFASVRSSLQPRLRDHRGQDGREAVEAVRKKSRLSSRCNMSGYRDRSVPRDVGNRPMLPFINAHGSKR